MSYNLTLFIEILAYSLYCGAVAQAWYIRTKDGSSSSVGAGMVAFIFAPVAGPMLLGAIAVDWFDKLRRVKRGSP